MSMMWTKLGNKDNVSTYEKDATIKILQSLSYWYN